LSQLGYPAKPPAVEARLDRLAQQANVVVLVADRGGEPAGLATAHILDVIHADAALAILTALVVGEAHRHHGIGRSLVDAAETWAIQRGASRITVATGLARAGAHAFYERLGYEHTARRYAKDLGGAKRSANAGGRAASVT
jgi:GNAT superfamily N-acetyltransferase